MPTHNKLKDYEKALAFGACAEEFSASWGRRHAIVDHFRRAAESVVLNIAEGARLLSEPDKARTLEPNHCDATQILKILKVLKFQSPISGSTKFPTKESQRRPKNGQSPVADQEVCPTYP